MELKVLNDSLTSFQWSKIGQTLPNWLFNNIGTHFYESLLRKSSVRGRKNKFASPCSIRCCHFVGFRYDWLFNFNILWSFTENSAQNGREKELRKHYLISINHFQIDRNVACLNSQISPNHYFQFLLGIIYSLPKRMRIKDKNRQNLIEGQGGR